MTRSDDRRPWRSLAFSAFAALGITGSCTAMEPAGTAGNTVESHGGTTTVHLNMSLLATLGLRVGEVKQGLPVPDAGKRGSYRNLRFAALDLSVFRFRETDGVPRAFTGGALQHAGGFVLAYPGGYADLRGFTLRPNGRGAFGLDLVGGDAHTWFTLAHGHYKLEDGNRRFASRVMNLALSPYFAARLGHPELAGFVVGGVDTLSPVSSSESATISSGVCSAPWPSAAAPADIRVIFQTNDLETDKPDTVHFMRCGLPNGSGGYTDASCTATSTDRGVVFAPDTSLQNVGTSAVPWHEMFSSPSPPYGNDQHPFLIWNLYRVDADGSLRQLAASGVKHAFATINGACPCSDTTVSYPTCQDSYSDYSNDIDANTEPNFLGPRSELIPATGQWGRCLSIFDKDCNGVLDNDAGAQNDFQYRAVVLESDLMQAGAKYYFEYRYIVRDQANIYDAIGVRPITPTKAMAGSSYAWDTTPGAFVSGPVINLWVDPASPPAGAANAELATPEGRARIAVKTTALGDGTYRYDYAVMNFDFARAVIDPAHPSEPNLHVESADGFSAFTVPVSPGVTITNATFADLDHDASNDWTFTQSGNALRWQAPAGHPLEWGTLYRFSFVASQAPLPSSAALDVATPGSPAQYFGATLAPLVDEIFHDRFGD